MKKRWFALLLGSMFSLLTWSAQAQTVMFDFDAGSPALSVGQSIPFDQTNGGVTASFSSPYGTVYSIQNAASTGFVLSQFSEKYLYPNTVDRVYLHIRFSRRITNISLTFSTIDYHDPGGTGTPLKLTAYENSTATPAIGSATASGAFSSDSYPQGVLTYNSGARSFNLVQIEIVPVAQGASAFLVDKIIVTPSSQVGSLSVAIEPNAAVAAGAQWRRVGTTTWQDSGATESNIDAGTYAVEFKAIAGWDAPANQSVTINAGQTTQANGVYVRQTGALKVTIQPAQAVTAGAKWRREGTTTWMNSGATESGIATGSVTIELKAVSGWTAPAGGGVTILNGQTVQVVRTYTQNLNAVDAMNWMFYQ